MHSNEEKFPDSLIDNNKLWNQKCDDESSNQSLIDNSNYYVFNISRHTLLIANKKLSSFGLNKNHLDPEH